MKPILVTVILAIVLVAVNTYSLKAQTSEQLYQKGLMKEEGEGALQDAINFYNQVADNSNASISLQAKALLHIGMCYEKLGMQEAVKAYQRLVSNFPAQKNEVAIARERLLKLIQIADKISETPLTPRFTKIQIPTKLSMSVSLSPDGQDLALISENKIWLMPLSGNLGPDIPGKPVQLNTEGIEVEWSGLSWSADKNWIAFNENPLLDKNKREKLIQSVFIVPANGGKPTKIIEDFRDLRIENYRISLSPNGKNLAYSSVENNEQHVYTTQVTGDSPKQLVNIQAREPVFSPDGKWIAYVEDKNLGNKGGNLWIVPAGGGVSKLIAKSGNASSPVWSPDGNMIAFLDRDKNKQVNFVRLPKDGELSGQVTSLNAPEGTEEVRQLAGWAPDNKIGVLLTSKQKFALYTLPAKGGQAAIVLNNYFAVQPRWSPDRSKIFYVTPEGERPQWAYGLVMASVPAIGGSGKLLIKNQDVKVIHPFAPQAGIRVSPDGKTIVLAGWTSGDTVFGSLPATRIWKLSSDGLKSEKITNEEGSFVDLSPSWSPDGQKIAFLRYRIKEVIGSNIKYEKTSIYIINSSGGEPELLVEPDNFLLLSVWSPDGKMIAYISKGEEAKFFLNVINVDNGAVTVLYEIPSFTPTLDPCWSPDSKRIAFNDGKVIKIINLNDGSSEDIKTNLTDDGYIFYLDWSHDGEQFVFGGWKGGNPEFWFLQDFLPLEKMVQKNETVKLE